MSSVEGEKKEFFLLIKEMRKLNAPLSKKDFFFMLLLMMEKKKLIECQKRLVF